MLIKKELEQSAILKYPILPRTKDKRSGTSKYVAAAEVLNLKRSGQILVIDIFLREEKSLKLRFFSDGKAFLVCKEWPVQNWVKQYPSSLLENQYDYFDIEARESDCKIAHEILKDGYRSDGYRSWRSVHGIKAEMDNFISGLYARKRDQTMDRKYAKMEEHFNMFPDYPADLAAFCETEVFRFTNIFLSKIKKGNREAICGHCGHEFTVTKDDKPGREGICPACGMQGKYRGQWSNGTYKDKAKICIAHKVENQLLIRWTNITRTFIDMKKKYDYDDYFRNLYLNTPKGPIIYAYAYKPQIGMGWCWFRQKNNTVHYDKSYVYANNLTEVFGKSYYHVDLQAGLKNAGRLSFTSLLDNLKNIPASEYLFKLGLSVLAADITKITLGKGAGFLKVLGVSKQYLPLYRKYNVTLPEHMIIKASKTWVSEASFEKLRYLAPEYSDLDNILNILKDMSFERFVNYFAKQKMILNKKLPYVLILYQDYISMSVTLKVGLSRKAVRFPQNIKEAHDLILSRFNQVKVKHEDETFKRAVKKLYSEFGINGYANNKYVIAFPALRSDLIREGQALNHCVGIDRYYKNHIDGKYMIFFIRRAADPEKPYFTMEADMKNHKILQLYGFGDRPAPTEIRKFANEFLKRLNPSREEIRIRVMVPA